MKRFILLAIAAALAALWTADAWGAPVEAGILASSAGKVEVKTQGEKTWTTILDGQILYQGSTVRTGKESRARLLMKDSTVLMLGENSELEINEYAATSEKTTSMLTMFKGKILSAIAKTLSSSSKYEIRTPTAVAGVRGTYLGMEVSEDEGRTELWVLSGKVNLKNLLEAGGEGMDVNAGYMTRVMPGVAPIPPTLADLDKIRLFIHAMKRPMFLKHMPIVDTKAMLSDALVKPVFPQAYGQKDLGAVFTSRAAGAAMPPVRQEKSMKPDDVRVIIKVSFPDQGKKQ